MKRKEPNYPLDQLQGEIERVIISLDEDDVVRFAANPVDFIDSRFEPTEIQFLATQRLTAIASRMIDFAVETSQRAQRSIASRILAELIQNIDSMSDLSKLRHESRRDFVSSLTELGSRAGLKDRNHLSLFLSKVSDQLNIDECLQVASFIGQTYQMFPEGNKAPSALAFKSIVNRIFNSDLELSEEQQQTFQNAFESIIKFGNKFDTAKALWGIGKYLRMAPDNFDKNLELILESIQDHPDRDEFHSFVASFSGRIAQGVQDLSDDLTPDELDGRLELVEKVFSGLASDPNPKVRIALIEEIGLALDRLTRFDHHVGEAVEILRRDPHPGVAHAFDRQVERGFLGSVGASGFDRFD